MRWRHIARHALGLAAFGVLSTSPACSDRLPDSPLQAATHANAAPFLKDFAVTSVNGSGELQVAQFTPPAGTADWKWGDPAKIGGGFDRAAPIVFVKGGTEMYVFALQKMGGDANLVAAYHKYGSGESVSATDVFSQQLLRYNCVQGAGSFGAAPVPDGSGIIFVTTDPGLQTATVSYCIWTGGDNWVPALTTVKTIPLPADLPPAYDGNISAAVTLNFDRMASWYPYRLTLALHPGLGSGESIRTREYRLNTFIPEPNRTRYFLTTVPGDDRWNTLGGMDMGMGISMHEGVDGRVYIAGASPTGPTLYARTGFDPLTQAATWVTAANLDPGIYGYTGDVPGFTYHPIFNPPATADQPFPIERLAFTNNNVDQKVVAYTEPFGKGRRKGIPQTPRSAAGLVVGIIEGPPPFDNKNLNLDPSWDLQASNTAETNFAVTNTSTATVSGAMEAGLSVGFSASAGFGYAGFDFGVEASVDLEEDFGTSYKYENTDTSEQSVKVALETEAAPGGGEQVRPRGTLVLAKMGFVGRAYEFLDPGDNPIPGARLYSQIWPTGVDFAVTQYWMNPNGRQPGNLQSYIPLNPETLDDLAAASKIKFTGTGGNSTDYLVFSWAGGSTVSQSWQAFQANQNSQSNAFSIKSALKISASTPVAGFEASLGSSLTVSREWGTGTSETVGLSTVEDVRNNINAPDSYSSATYRTYLLSDSNDYIRELLSDDPNGIGLVTTAWPPIGSLMRRQNEDVKAQIIRTSTPWKITYLVTDAQYNPPGNPPSGFPVLEARLSRKLERYGIRTAGAMRLLLESEKLERSAAFGRPNVVEPWRVTQERRRQSARLTMQKAELPAGVLLNAARAALTSAEIAAIRRYVDGVNAVERARWRQANPLRYPLFPPAGVRNAPDLRDSRPDYTRIPPPELPSR